MADSYIRWQEITRDHMGKLINIVLSLATGLLAYDAALLIEHKYAASWAFVFGILAVVLLFGSVGFALWCAVNRLNDFRLTAQIARGREKGASDLNEKRELSILLGKTTWRLLRTQLWLFGSGAGATAVAVLFQVLH